MSIEAAHEFIRAVRAGAVELEDDHDVDDVVASGAARGYDFSAAELRTAFRQDFILRGLATPPWGQSTPENPCPGAPSVGHVAARAAERAESARANAR